MDLECKYCPYSVKLQLIKDGKVFYCPMCDTYYANNEEIREQLSQATRKNVRKNAEYKV